MTTRYHEQPEARTWPNFLQPGNQPGNQPACRQPGIDPEVFYPGEHTSAAAAKAICRRCPIQRACLDFAITTGQRHGIWGGHTTAERGQERARRQRARHLGLDQAAPPDACPGPGPCPAADAGYTHNHAPGAAP